MSYIMREYLCDEHGRWESLERRYAVRRRMCKVCRKLCPRVISAVAGRVKVGEVGRGESAERPPGALDTRTIARRAGVDC